MKQLLLATAAVVGMSAAALAAEPVALTDSQLDNVTAGATIDALLLPIALGQASALAIPPFLAATDLSNFATNIVHTTITAP
jgi:hypothetical protein